MDSSTSRFATSKNVFLEYIFTYAVADQISNRKYLLDFIERRSKVHQTNVSRERSLNFDQ